MIKEFLTSLRISTVQMKHVIRLDVQQSGAVCQKPQLPVVVKSCFRKKGGVSRGRLMLVAVNSVCPKVTQVFIKY